ncbi:uncharacterized protein LOC108108383 [Drosophila eugracilis]|uniref:uncharacterized protein LOC108108383 n=1 Tax=Drosophila eugracilis TaxID=29029 RepID=UPI001BD9E83F|nr:uncharacterized protein LOC108108383 [Drosophila eugracilis]XP_017071921.2 uncharacterized protein LOC108108383 [Drosophila eugracilis]
MDTGNSDVERALVRKYPGLTVELKPSGSCSISGVICNKGIWRSLKLYLPHYPVLHGFVLYVQFGVEYKIFSPDNLKLQDDWMLEDLLDNLEKILPAKETESISKKPKTTYQGNIYSDILDLRKSKEYRMQIDDDCSVLRLSEFNEHERHYLELEIPSLRVRDHSLPECVSLGEMLTKSARTLEEVINLFRKLLEDLRPFYDNFMDIDELCHVLQPSPATTKHKSRVFPLKDRVYLKLTIGDPFACIASMALQIIGPTDEVAQLRQVLSEGLGNWDSEVDIHKNLLRMFDLCFFPMPDWCDGPKQDEEDNEELRCNICFSYRLDSGEVPLVSCDNPKCVLRCHAGCLKEWFQTQMEGKTFLEVSFGLCPFCKAKLSTSFAALLDE